MYSYVFCQLHSSLKGVLLILNAMLTSTRKPKQGTASSSRKTVQIRTEIHSNLEKQVQSTILVSGYMCHGLSLLEMHSGGERPAPWCRPTCWAFLVQGDLILIYLLGRSLLGGAYGQQSLLCWYSYSCQCLTHCCIIN